MCLLAEIAHKKEGKNLWTIKPLLFIRLNMEALKNIHNGLRIFTRCFN